MKLEKHCFCASRSLSSDLETVQYREKKKVLLAFVFLANDARTVKPGTSHVSGMETICSYGSW